MSPSEKASILGELVMDYVDARDNLAALEAKIKKMGSVLVKVGQALEGGGYQSVDLEADIANLPTPVQLKALIVEARETMRKRDDAHQSLKRNKIDIT